MGYNIYDNGDCIKFIKDGQIVFVSKGSITGIAVIREDVIKICRANCLGNIYFRHQDVSFPFSYTALTLVIIINSYVSNLPLPPPNP